MRSTKTLILSVLLSAPMLSFAQFTSDDGIITVDNFSDLDDKEEVVMEASSQQANFSNDHNSNCAVFKVLRRFYEVTLIKGDPGTMDMHVDLNALSGYDDANRIHLMNDVDRDGYDNDRPIAGVVNGNTISFYGISLNDNSKITFGEAVTAYYAVSSGAMTDPIWAESSGGTADDAHNFCEYISLIIESGVNVDINQNSKHIDDLTIESGATLNYDVASGNKRLFLHGDLHIDGTYTSENTTIEFMGSTPQNITGSIAQIKSIRMNNPTEVNILSSGLEIIDRLSVSQGTLNSNGALTLKSTASNTASIGDLNNADIVGDINVERFHNASTGWFMLASPVSGNTISDWNDELVTTGFTGSDYPLTSFVNIQSYDESVPGGRNNGWTPVNDVNDPILNNAGYYVYASEGAQTVVSTGAVRKGYQELAVTFSNESSAADGFCMVGNPYPSAIDWNSTAWTKINMDDVVYVYDASVGGYATYINGVGNNGGSNIIPSSQAFFVKANGVDPVLAVDEAVKSTESGDFKMFLEKELIRLNITQDGMQDAITIVNNSNGRMDKMPKVDAERMPVMPSMLSFGMVLGDGLYAIKNLNLEEDQSIPLYVNTESNEAIEISLVENSLLSNKYVAIHDKLTGEVTPLHTNDTFEVQNDDEYRYELIIQDNSEVSILNERLSGTIVQNGDQLTFQLNADAGNPAQIAIWNAMGQMIRSGINIQPGQRMNVDISDISGQFIARMMNEQNGKNITRNCIR